MCMRVYILHIYYLCPIHVFCFGCRTCSHWNPRSSAKVHKVTWYMLHYGAVTPKQHYMLSNCRHIAHLWVDRLKNWAATKKKLEAQGKSKKLVVKYVDKQEKQRWKGTRELRSSESGSYLLVNRWHWVTSITCFLNRIIRTYLIIL